MELLPARLRVANKSVNLAVAWETNNNNNNVLENVEAGSDRSDRRTRLWKPRYSCVISSSSPWNLQCMISFPPISDQGGGALQPLSPN